MQTGISTASLFPRLNTEDALEKIKSLGADCAEIFFSTFYEYRPEFAKSLAERVQGLKINSVHANSCNFEPNFFNPSHRVKGDGYYWLDQIGRSARLLGCGNYTFHGFNRINGRANDDFDAFAAGLNEICDFASDYSLKICLENVRWSLYDRPGVFSQLKSRTPALGAVFDIKQARMSGYPYQAYIKDMSGAIQYAHLSDVDEMGRTCLPGTGIYDFTDIISRLVGEGFDGALLIEVYADNYSDFGDIARSVEFIKEVAYKLK